ncbi:MAG: hypothetical protein CM15mP23_08530 [Cryomorphaceae bacterium]|nr:MAG: hypothetical protein CM15mP23_08530 [Cryomorphaceae bacterium]
MDLHSADKFIGEGLTYDDVLLVPAILKFYLVMLTLHLNFQEIYP